MLLAASVCANQVCVPGSLSAFIPFKLKLLLPLRIKQLRQLKRFRTCQLVVFELEECSCLSRTPLYCFPGPGALACVVSLDAREGLDHQWRHHLAHPVMVGIAGVVLNGVNIGTWIQGNSGGNWFGIQAGIELFVFLAVFLLWHSRKCQIQFERGWLGARA
jgi:hypothetical protein